MNRIIINIYLVKIKISDKIFKKESRKIFKKVNLYKILATALIKKSNKLKFSKKALPWRVL
jgi:hypothetical protein